jgi:hypothetical protein
VSDAAHDAKMRAVRLKGTRPPRPRTAPLYRERPAQGRDLNEAMNPLVDHTTGLVEDYTGKQTVPRTRGFRSAWTETPRYGGVILYVEDDNGQEWSLYHQFDNPDAEQIEADVGEYWYGIETQGWTLESEPQTWLSVARSRRDVLDSDLDALAQRTFEDLDLVDDTAPEAFLADAEELLQDFAPNLSGTDYQEVRARFQALMEQRGVIWRAVPDE